MKTNDDAMALGGIAFGMFCLIIVVAAGVYIISFNSSQPTITDTYGNTLGNVGNQSQLLVNNATASSGSYMVPLILIVGVILLIAVIFALYLASKSF